VSLTAVGNKRPKQSFSSFCSDNFNQSETMSEEEKEPQQKIQQKKRMQNSQESIGIEVLNKRQKK